MRNTDLLKATSYDHLAADYDAIYGTPMALAENAVTFAYLQREMMAAQAILDAGCGTGLLLDSLPIIPQCYHGLDISLPILEVAQQKHPRHHFLHGDMADLSYFPAGSFDLVTCLFASFNQVDDPGHVVMEFARILAPGGRVMCMTNSKRPRARSSYGFTEQEATHPDTTFLLNAKELRSLFEPAFTDISLIGLHCLPEQICPHAPYAFLRVLLWLEMQTIGRFLPDACYFHILTATVQSRKEVRHGSTSKRCARTMALW